MKNLKLVFRLGVIALSLLTPAFGQNEVSESMQKQEIIKITKNDFKSFPTGGIESFTDNGRIVIWEAKKGKYYPFHNNNGEEIAYIIKGKIEFEEKETGKKVIVGAGEFLRVGAKLVHAAQVLEDFEMIAFYPATLANEGMVFPYKGNYKTKK